MTKIQNPKKEYTSAVGRRRESIARVRLYKGKGENVINGLTFEKYFPGVVASVKFNKPFQVTNSVDQYWVSVKVAGGGKSGQLDAVVHGIARTLSAVDKEKNRPSLKKNKLLTRDPRTRERRKVGMGGKSRRKKQSPKR